MTVAAGGRTVSWLLVRGRLRSTVAVLLRLAVSVLLRRLRLAVARLLRVLTVTGLRRLPIAAGGTTLRRSPSPVLHQNFTDEPQPQLPVVFGLLNLKPEPWTPST